MLLIGRHSNLDSFFTCWHDKKKRLESRFYSVRIQKNPKTKYTVASEMNWIPIWGGMTVELWGTSLHKVIPLQLYANLEDYLTSKEWRGNNLETRHNNQNSFTGCPVLLCNTLSFLKNCWWNSNVQTSWTHKTPKFHLNVNISLKSSSMNITKQYRTPCMIKMLTWHLMFLCHLKSDVRTFLFSLAFFHKMQFSGHSITSKKRG